MELYEDEVETRVLQVWGKQLIKSCAFYGVLLSLKKHEVVELQLLCSEMYFVKVP